MFFFDRPVPPLAGAGCVLRPCAAAHGFDGNDGGAFASGFFKDSTTEIAFVVFDEIDWKHDGVEVEAFESFEGGFGRVCGETDEPDFAFLFGFEESFHCSARADRLFDFVDPHQVMQLVQVEVVGLECAQGVFQFLSCPVFVAHFGFAGEEDAVAVEALKSDAHFGFCLAIAVSGGYVEVIDSVVEGFVEAVGTCFLVIMDKGQAGESDDRYLAAGTSEGAFGDGGFGCGWCGWVLGCAGGSGQSDGEDCCSAADCSKEFSSFHFWRCLGSK